MLEPCPDPPVSTTYGRPSISIPTLVALVAKSWHWRANTVKIWSTLWSRLRTLSTRCQTSWINLCMSPSTRLLLSILISLHRESVFGYITVLPGAFSAYRYIALQNDSVGEGPLQKYFLGEKMVCYALLSDEAVIQYNRLQHGSGADIFTANMYLAEDRVSNLPGVSCAHPHDLSDSLLGIGIETRWFMDSSLREVCLCRYWCTWPSKFFVPALVSTFENLIIWRNPGSRTDISTSSLAQWLFLRGRSQHHPFLLHLSLFAHFPSQVLDPRGNVLSIFQSDFFLVLSGKRWHPMSWWLALTALPQANYYIAFAILSSALETLLSPDPDHPNKIIMIFNAIINYFYLGLLITCFILALGNRPQGSKWGYTTAFIGFGLITIYMTVCGIQRF